MVKQRVHGQHAAEEEQGERTEAVAGGALPRPLFASAGGSNLAKKKHLRGGLSGKQQLAARLRAEARAGPQLGERGGARSGRSGEGRRRSRSGPTGWSACAAR